MRNEKIKKLTDLQRTVADKKQECDSFQTEMDKISDEVGKIRSELRDKR